MSVDADPSADVKGIAPLVTPETEVFWAEAAEGRLVVDHCTSCGANYFPPRRWCAACMTADTIDPAHQLHGPATLYSFTDNRRAWMPGMQVPFILGVAHFEEAPGVRIPVRVRTDEPEQLQMDCLLDIGFETGPKGFAIPSFTVAAPPSDTTT